MVNLSGAPLQSQRATGTAVGGRVRHRLPVDQAFTLEAGRTIWGYPKVMADFTVPDGRQFGFDMTIDGLAVSMEFRPGPSVPAAFTSRRRVHSTYSRLDDVTRETPGEMVMSGVRHRPGGVSVRLGDRHYAAELAGLGFPKRALVSGSAANVDTTFGHPKEIV